MKKLSIGLLFIFLILHFSSCSEGTTNPNGNEITFSANQVPGCGGLKSLSKATSFDDSCFMYDFEETLKIDFCVYGNCCPDSNRFVTSYNLNSDTLLVTVTDTAEHLCDCICNYTIHLEISGLQGDEYLFYCDYDSVFAYREKLIRK